MTNTNQQEQLYRWVKASERLPEQYKSVPIRPNGLDQYFATAFNDGKVIWVGDNPNRLAEISEIEWLEPYTPPLEDGKQGGVHNLILYFQQQLFLQKDKKFKQTGEEALLDAIEVCQNLLKSQPSTPVQPGERINKVKDAIGFLLSCAYPEMIASEYNRNKEVLTEICKLIDTIATSTPVQDGWVKIEDGCKLPVIPPPYKEDGCTITPMEVPILCHQDDSICLDWYNDSGIEWFQLKEYTHWQPLPSPPVNNQD